MSIAAPPPAPDAHRRRRTLMTLRAGGALLGGLLWVAGSAQAAQPPVGLGTAAPFAALAGSTITNTGPSTLGGDLGLSPGTAVSGFGGAGNGTVRGDTHVADAVALQAKSDLDIAYSDAAGRAPAADLPADLAGAGVLTAGVHRASSSLQLTGSVTLDAQGDPSAVFVIQVGSALTTAAGSTVLLVNGAQPCNVFWQVGSSATLGTGSDFSGTLMADQSVSLLDSVTVHGRVLARVAAVTLVNDTILRPACATAPTSDPEPTPTPTPEPEPTPTPTPTPQPTLAPEPALTPVTASEPAPAPVAGSSPTSAGAPAPTPTTSVSSPAPGTHASGTPSPLPPRVTPGLTPSPAAGGPSPATATPTAPALTIVNNGTGRTSVLVTGPRIAAVSVAVDGRRVSSGAPAPFRTRVITRDGTHTLKVRVILKDGRSPVTFTRRFGTRRPRVRPVAATPLSLSRPPLIGSGFTG